MVWVVVVAIVAKIGIDGERHRPHFRELADFHESNAVCTTNWTIEERRAWHEQLWHKYDFAARHPWFPVWPDPPEPPFPTVPPLSEHIKKIRAIAPARR